MNQELRKHQKNTDVGYKLGMEIAEKDHILVFGCGNGGIMDAVASGAFDNEGKIISIYPNWIKKLDDRFKNTSQSIETDSMDERKRFLEKSDVFVICPGGCGTLDEFFDVLTLKYLHRHSKKSFFSI